MIIETEKIPLEQLTEDAVKICVTGHIRPDGDCVGGCLAVYNYLTDFDPSLKVDVYLEPCPETFSFLNGFDTIHTYQEGEYDLCFVVDVSDKERLGKNSALPDHSAKTICIDHHATCTGYGDRCFVHPEASAICELLYDMMDYEKISTRTAECLYLGIAHDTGVFRHSNVTRHTMEAAGALIEKGADSSRIAMDTYFSRTYLEAQMLGLALSKSILFCDNRCIVSAISQKDMDLYHATQMDLEGIVEQLQETEGVECAIFVSELEHNSKRVSLRSNKYVDVSRVAAYFGGGGHVRAAGCTMNGTFYDVVNNLSEQIMLQLKN